MPTHRSLVMQTGGIYGALRNLLVEATTAINPTVEPTAVGGLPNLEEGSFMVRSIGGLRVVLGAFLPTRFLADIVIVVAFVLLSGYLGLTVLSSCRRFGCALIQTVLLALVFVVTVAWLVTAARLSDNEFHDHYMYGLEWMISALKNRTPLA